MIRALFIWEAPPPPPQPAPLTMREVMLLLVVAELDQSRSATQLSLCLAALRLPPGERVRLPVPRHEAEILHAVPKRVLRHAKGLGRRSDVALCVGQSPDKADDMRRRCRLVGGEREPDHASSPRANAASPSGPRYGSGVPATSALGEEIRAAIAHRDALRAWEPPPFVSQPNIPVEGHHDGLSWGRIDVPWDAYAWRVLMTTEPVPVSYVALSIRADTAIFQRQRFHGTDAAVFVREGLDVERVAAVLPVMLGGAS